MPKPFPSSSPKIDVHCFLPCGLYKWGIGAGFSRSSSDRQKSPLTWPRHNGYSEKIYIHFCGRLGKESTLCQLLEILLLLLQIFGRTLIGDSSAPELDSCWLVILLRQVVWKVASLWLSCSAISSTLIHGSSTIVIYTVESVELHRNLVNSIQYWPQILKWIPNFRSFQP